MSRSFRQCPICLSSWWWRYTTHLHSRTHTPCHRVIRAATAMETVTTSWWCSSSGNSDGRRDDGGKGDFKGDGHGDGNDNNRTTNTTTNTIKNTTTKMTTKATPTKTKNVAAIIIIPSERRQWRGQTTRTRGLFVSVEILTTIYQSTYVRLQEQWGYT